MRLNFLEMEKNDNLDCSLFFLKRILFRRGEWVFVLGLFEFLFYCLY